MIFIISMVLAALFTASCKKLLKRSPVPFYLLAVVISAAVFACTAAGTVFPSWFSTWIWPVFSRSGFATALWVTVMWAGALPNGSALMKQIMPIRGELSIIAAILTLGHNAAYGRTYFLRIAQLPPAQLAASVCSIIMILIMLPLFITSFKTVRRKMKAGSWKKLQRLAYGFYGFLYIHIMLLTVPAVMAGRSGYLINALVYSVVFLGYFMCRIIKALDIKSKSTGKFPRHQKQAMAAALVLSLGVTGLLSACGASPDTLSSDTEDTSDDIEIEEQLENEDDENIDDTAPADSEVSGEETPVTDNTSSVNQKTSDTTSQKADAKTKAAAPVSSANTNSGTTSKTTNTPSSDTQKSAENKTVQTETPAQNTTTVSEPARTYKNGTFSGSGTGYAGPISVSVTIKDDVITAISVTSSSDDEPFISDAKGVISKMLSAQSANVDTVSGATYSSKGIISAVKSALASAKN
jgi:DMSO/TMAO reductase YedYZ heme-binding membrane subunit/uncharacterized protein with FMN-binding domain